MNGQRIGYVRVTSLDQNPDHQLEQIALAKQRGVSRGGRRRSGSATGRGTSTGDCGGGEGGGGTGICDQRGDALSVPADGRVSRALA
jgi:hypothetical protein